MRAVVWERLTRNRLFLDQTDTPLEIDRTQVERFYHPLASTLLSRCSSLPRFLVAIAGPPGSGKTALATILVAVINAEAGNEVAVSIGLDGWHYPNAYLSSHTLERDGKQITLRDIKGAPETFDATAAYRCLLQVRQGGRISFPVYSRRLHEPVARGGYVDPAHKIVVVEGNYLLLDEEPWRRFRPLFDIRMYISASPDTLIASLERRHRRGGKTPDAIARHIREVDLPNARRVAPGAAYAHILVHKVDDRHIARLEWLVEDQNGMTKV
ncbi:MAG: nucleoside triphosphate hydrolase [Anaerolineae bacterium]